MRRTDRLKIAREFLVVVDDVTEAKYPAIDSEGIAWAQLLALGGIAFSLLDIAESLRKITNQPTNQTKDTSQ